MKKEFVERAKVCIERVPYATYHDCDVIPEIAHELLNEHIRALEWSLQNNDSSVIQTRIDELKFILNNYWTIK